MIVKLDRKKAEDIKDDPHTNALLVITKLSDQRKVKGNELACLPKDILRFLFACSCGIGASRPLCFAASSCTARLGYHEDPSPCLKKFS